MSHPSPPAGWYPDPDGKGGRRYWDGIRWGLQERRKRTWPIVLTVSVVVIGFAFMIFGNKKPDEAEPGRSDSAQDRVFLDKLDAMDVPYGSRRNAVLKAEALCLFFAANPNAEFSDGVAEVRREMFPDLSGADAAMKPLSFAAAATDVYCPEYKPGG